MREDRTNNSDTGTVEALMWIAVFIIILVLNAYARAAGPVPPTLPDPKLTPGASFPAVVSSLTKEQLCARGFTTKKIRNVTEETKAAIYKSYGMRDHVGECHCPVTDKKTGKVVDQGCEVDHA